MDGDAPIGACAQYNQDYIKSGPIVCIAPSPHTPTPSAGAGDVAHQDVAHRRSNTGSARPHFHRGLRGGKPRVHGGSGRDRSASGCRSRARGNPVPHFHRGLRGGRLAGLPPWTPACAGVTEARPGVVPAKAGTQPPVCAGASPACTGAAGVTEARPGVVPAKAGTQPPTKHVVKAVARTLAAMSEDAVPGSLGLARVGTHAGPTRFTMPAPLVQPPPDRPPRALRCRQARSRRSGVAAPRP